MLSGEVIVAIAIVCCRQFPNKRQQISNHFFWSASAFHPICRSLSLVCAPCSSSSNSILRLILFIISNRSNCKTIKEIQVQVARKYLYIQLVYICSIVLKQCGCRTLELIYRTRTHTHKIATTDRTYNVQCFEKYCYRSVPTQNNCVTWNNNNVSYVPCSVRTVYVDIFLKKVMASNWFNVLVKNMILFLA